MSITPSQIIQSASLREWLALLNVPGLGPSTFFKLAQAFPSLTAILQASPSELAATGLNPNLCSAIKDPNWTAVDNAMRWAEQPLQTIITWNDAAYPALLREIASPPPVLYVKGNYHCLQTLQLALVGSRNPTPAGKDAAWQFAKHLSETGITITSGLALGIDAASHNGCLAAGGRTIAVTGTGLQHIYPVCHKQLAEQILEKEGALVSEFALDIPAAPANFPRRNRLISGLSRGVIVIEAALKSGSLITARYALEQGREVFAMPGSIHNPLARGCHALIRQGAKLIETTQDILEEFQGIQGVNALSATSVKPTVSLAAGHAQLIECLGFETTSLDIIVCRTGLTVDVVSSMLLELELQGHIAAVPGGYVRL